MNKKISITKTGILPGGEISDFNKTGQTRVGYMREFPTVGERFYVWDRPNAMWDCWSTSIVTKIIDSSTFETTYSVYHYEVIDEELHEGIS